MKRFVFITVIMLLSGFKIYGQISIQEEPVSFKTNVPHLRTSVILI
jgi:hypothetical protein